MKRNVGAVDARIRVGLGLGLAALAALVATGVLSVPYGSAVGLGLAAVVLTIEGATRRCLLYQALGIDRCPVDQ